MSFLKNNKNAYSMRKWINFKHIRKNSDRPKRTNTLPCRYCRYPALPAGLLAWVWHKIVWKSVITLKSWSCALLSSWKIIYYLRFMKKFFLKIFFFNFNEKFKVLKINLSFDLQFVFHLEVPCILSLNSTLNLLME